MNSHTMNPDDVDTALIHTGTLHNTCIAIGRCRYTPIHSDTHRYTPQYMYHDRTLSIRSDTREYTFDTHVSRSGAVDTLRYTRIHVKYSTGTLYLAPSGTYSLALGSQLKEPLLLLVTRVVALLLAGKGGGRVSESPGLGLVRGLGQRLPLAHPSKLVAHVETLEDVVDGEHMGADAVPLEPLAVAHELKMVAFARTVAPLGQRRLHKVHGLAEAGEHLQAALCGAGQQRLKGREGGPARLHMAKPDQRPEGIRSRAA